MRAFALLTTTLLAITVMIANSGNANAQSTSKTIETVVFSTLEKRLIREILGASGVETESETRRQTAEKTGKQKDKGKGKKGGKKQGGLPPGLAKKNGLPPGLARREILPPGLQKRQLPASLERQLPTRTRTERVIIDNDVLLIERGTNLVLDILEDVIKDAL